MRARLVLHVVSLTSLCALLLAPAIAHAQQCTRRAVLEASADVYRLPPRYVTGVGWQGERIDVLNRGTQVLQCTSRSVAFGFSSKSWSQVAFKRGNDWRYGWILDETLRFVSGGKVLGTQVPGAARVVPAAYRVVADEAASNSPWTIGDAAPPPPATPEPAKAVTQAAVNTPSLSEQLGLYWPLFLAMLLGMAAKAAVDLVEEWDKALVVRHLRNGVIAFLVSPIVFLGFLNAGEFDGSAQTFLVLLMLSFQNGFFWQTILKSDLRRKAS